MKFEKIKELKKGKHAVTAGCLALGVCLLSTSVYANYDDAKGYSNYKEAVMNLAFEEDNYTGEGKISLIIDGEESWAMGMEGLVDGNDLKTIGTFYVDGVEISKNESVIKGKKSYNYDSLTNKYYEHESYDWRIDTSDKTSKKAIRFMELFADTMVGDLKNNFVLASKDGDLREYEINVSGNQMPELINAGVSLIFTGMSEAESYAGRDGGVEYEDYTANLIRFYNEKKNTNLTLEQYYNSDDDIDIYEYADDMDRKYEAVFKEKCNGEEVLYVKEDGTTKVYKDYKELYKETQPSNLLGAFSLVSLLGEDPYIKDASCVYTIDKNGKLQSNSMIATMVGKDKSGEQHSVTLKIEGKFKDYGSTSVPDFDKTGKEAVVI